MKTVDYNRIARTYDSLPIRNAIEPDAWLTERLGAIPADARFAVVDIGCGTGTWLSVQRKAFESKRVAFTGIDPSPGMLEQARAKLRGQSVDLHQGSAERLPFGTESIDFAACRFAFHHVTDKPRAFDEAQRVLATDGSLLLVNIAPEEMPGWWVFRYFPTATESNAKFWSQSRIEESLHLRAFDVKAEIRKSQSEIAIADALEQVRMRDQSHLAALDDATYTEGLRAMEALLEKDRDAKVPTEMAVLTIRATRR